MRSRWQRRSRISPSSPSPRGLRLATRLRSHRRVLPQTTVPCPSPKTITTPLPNPPQPPTHPPRRGPATPPGDRPLRPLLRDRHRSQPPELPVSRPAHSCAIATDPNSCSCPRRTKVLVTVLCWLATRSLAANTPHSHAPPGAARVNVASRCNHCRDSKN